MIPLLYFAAAVGVLLYGFSQRALTTPKTPAEDKERWLAFIRLNDINPGRASDLVREELKRGRPKISYDTSLCSGDC